jgi:hypothetical protein
MTLHKSGIQRILVRKEQMRKRSAPTSPGLFEQIAMDPGRNGPVYFWRPGEANGFLGQWYTSPFIWKRPLTSHDGDGKEYEELKYENAEQ